MVRSPKKQDIRSAPAQVAANHADEAFKRAMLERLPRLTLPGVALRLITTALVFYSTWQAIHSYGATAPSLLLPMAAEVLAAIASGVVLAGFVLRDQRFTRQVWSGLRNWIVVAIGFLIWQCYQGAASHDGFGAQLRQTWLATRAFILDSGFLRAMLLAAAGYCAGVVNDVAAYRRNGPPFIYLSSLNFGLRTFLMLLLGWILFLVATFGRGITRLQIAEAMWVALLLAELFALWVPHVVQNRILAARVGRNQSSEAKTT